MPFIAALELDRIPLPLRRLAADAALMRVNAEAEFCAKCVLQPLPLHPTPAQEDEVEMITTRWRLARQDFDKGYRELARHLVELGHRL